MGKATIEDLICIFEEIIDISEAEINKDSVLGEDIPIDSGEMLRVMSRIESRYGFRFKPREILNLKTLGDILESVRSQI